MGMKEQDDEMAALALAEAKAAGLRGEVPIGAVLVSSEGAVLAKNGNRILELKDPTAHAEILVLREGAKLTGNERLVGATLYVTLEPCAMCAGAMVHARIHRLVYGATDPKGGAAGTLYDIPRDPRLNHRIAVRSGVLAADARRLLEDFFRARRG
jgi:tRNA(adenine34) deaminase